MTSTTSMTLIPYQSNVSFFLSMYVYTVVNNFFGVQYTFYSNALTKEH